MISQSGRELFGSRRVLQTSLCSEMLLLLILLLFRIIANIQHVHQGKKKKTSCIGQERKNKNDQENKRTRRRRMEE